MVRYDTWVILLTRMILRRWRGYILCTEYIFGYTLVNRTTAVSYDDAVGTFTFGWKIYISDEIERPMSCPVRPVSFLLYIHPYVTSWYFRPMYTCIQASDKHLPLYFVFINRIRV